jgi:hypothetical protein
LTVTNSDSEPLKLFIPFQFRKSTILFSSPNFSTA